MAWKMAFLEENSVSNSGIMPIMPHICRNCKLWGALLDICCKKGGVVKQLPFLVRTKHKTNSKCWKLSLECAILRSKQRCRGTRSKSKSKFGIIYLWFQLWRCVRGSVGLPVCQRPVWQNFLRVGETSAVLSKSDRFVAKCAVFFLELWKPPTLPPR